MNINDLTIGQAKELACLFGNKDDVSIDDNIDCEVLGTYAVIRTYSAGVWFGKVLKKSGNEIILGEARRLYYWKTNGGISLSEVSLTGLHSTSKVCEAVDKIWLQPIEIIPCTQVAIDSIRGQKNYVAR